MNLDNKTINMFEELSVDGVSIDTLGCLNAKKKIIESGEEIPDQENYTTQDLKNSPEQIKEMALKILLEKELEISNMVISAAKEELRQCGRRKISESLVLLAYKIIKENSLNARIQLSKKTYLNALVMKNPTPTDALQIQNL